jgi:prepilin-type N-terminal cleavage/methylation domain-containing protein
MKKGFSILELMIVMVIVVIISTFAIPSYAKYNERSRGKSAEANLSIIYNMEKRYKLDNGVYYECATSPCPGFSCPVTAGCSLEIINAELGLFIRDPYFTYKIEIEGASGYKATATRSSTGACADQTMTLTNASSVITKGCSEW